MFPDLVRQCLTTCEITYEDFDHPSFDTALFSLFAEGKKYTISMDAFIKIYELADELKGIPSLKKFPLNQAFWKLIAAGDFK